jgi:hypothetical protein
VVYLTLLECLRIGGCEGCLNVVSATFDIIVVWWYASFKNVWWTHLNPNTKVFVRKGAQGPVLTPRL